MKVHTITAANWSQYKVADPVTINDVVNLFGRLTWHLEEANKYELMASEDAAEWALCRLHGDSAGARECMKRSDLSQWRAGSERENVEQINRILTASVPFKTITTYETDKPEILMTLQHA
jgi:hypothetical protein